MKRFVSLVGMGLAVSPLAACAAPHSAGQRVVVPAGYDIGPVPRAQLKPGGTLRWPLPEFPVQWNVFQANGANGAVDIVVRGLMPYLMRTDEKAVSHPDPDYLRHVTLKRTAKGQVVTYTLNPEATWSDGTPITFRDFAAQAHALSGRDKRYLAASVTGYDQITKVERGRDDRQAVVTFRRTFADWASLFSPLYPAAADGDPDDFNKGWLGKLPITAGPFRPAGIDRTAKTITIGRNPNWWGRRAMLDAITFRVMDSATMPQAFANGEVDLFDIGGDAGAYARARQVRGAVIRRAGGPDWRHITLNASAPPLTDVQVRRAVTMGIDRRAIARSDLQGLDWPVQTLGNHFFVNTQQGYHDNSAELGAYDPGQAGRLLDQAGWVRHGKWRVKGGRELALRLVVPAAVATSRQEGELVQAMLEKVGVRVELQAVPADDLFDKYVLPGGFDLVPFSWFGTPFPVSSQRSVFALPHGGDIRQNYSRTGSAALDTLMDRATAELDPVAATRLTNDADRLVWQEATVIPLYQRPQLVAVRADLANIGARGFYDLAYEDIGFTGSHAH